MARIYSGQPNKIHPDVLEALKRLPRDFWVFAEFDVERNVDVFVVREVRDPTQHATLIVTEVKAQARPLRALSVNGLWERRNEAGEWEEIPAGGDDVNYYRQGVNSSNALQRWLYNNQRFYLEGPDLHPEDEFKPWPDLLIISPPGTTHQFPVRNPTNFGYWFHDVGSWARHLVDWQSRRGIGLTQWDLERLASVLRLPLLWEEEPGGATPLPEEPATPPDAVLALADWARQVEARLRSLEEKVSSLGGSEGRPTP